MSGRNVLANMMVVMVVAVLATVSIATATHETGRRFGARLTPNTQPSNASPAHDCGDDTAACTWVQVYATDRPSPPDAIHWARAPRDGTIKKIRLIAADPGSFRLQIAKAKPGLEQAKIVRNGPVIEYEGQPDSDEQYVIESFTVNVPVVKGQFLAINADTTSLLRCNSGGTRILQYQPGLPVGGALAPATDTDGCFMLLEAILE